MSVACVHDSTDQTMPNVNQARMIVFTLGIRCCMLWARAPFERMSVVACMRITLASL
jgi:hypothetical protein